MSSTLFEVHKLNEIGIGKAREIAGAFDQLLARLEELCPDGREFSIVKTKLEEASFFAKKAMAKDRVNQNA
jgi:hypothetical protein